MVAVCSAQVTLDPLSVPSLSLAARVELAPMEFSFVAYLRQINVPSAPSQTGSMDQHFFLSVCVCISFRYLVFTNLSPLPALPKPQRLLALLHRSVNLHTDFL